ncbi:hypothetical protein PENTCL1PPCAC_22477, partial [Pristionchus entomophagus]
DRVILSLFFPPMRSIPLLFLFFFFANAGNLKVRVLGRTSCQTVHDGIVGSKKVDGVKIQLWEEDLGENSVVDPDDLIDTADEVNKQGLFRLKGGQDETFNHQQFYVKIHFPCVANSTCNFVKYKKFCAQNPGEKYYMAKKQLIPKEYRFVEAPITYYIDYRMGYAHHEIDSDIPYL